MKSEKSTIAMARPVIQNIENVLVYFLACQHKQISGSRFVPKSDFRPCIPLCHLDTFDSPTALVFETLRPKDVGMRCNTAVLVDGLIEGAQYNSFKLELSPSSPIKAKMKMGMYHEDGTYGSNWWDVGFREGQFYVKEYVGYPGLFARTEGVYPECAELIRKMSMLALGLEFTSSCLWSIVVSCTINGPSVRLFTDSSGAKTLMDLRDQPNKRLIDWVGEHWRRLRSDPDIEVYVRKHLRGKERFNVGDFYCEIVPSADTPKTLDMLIEQRKKMRADGSDRRTRVILGNQIK